MVSILLLLRMYTIVDFAFIIINLPESNLEGSDYFKSFNYRMDWKIVVMVA